MQFRNIYLDHGLSALAFVGGAQMAGPVVVPLTTNVPPGQTVDVSVNLVAPQEIGAYRGFWGMRNPAGQQFETAVFVEIDVVGGSPATPSTPGPTNTPGPSNTPGPTNPPGKPGSARVSDVSLAVDDGSADACPHTFTFSASFDLSADSAVTYLLEAGSDTPGFTSRPAACQYGHIYSWFAYGFLYPQYLQCDDWLGALPCH